MKNLFLIVILFLSCKSINNVTAVAGTIKIGQYKYEKLIQESYNQEENYVVLSNVLRNIEDNTLHNIGTYLTFRRKGSSAALFSFKVDSVHPDDLRKNYQDGIILTEGSLFIDYERKQITNKILRLHKDISEDYDSLLHTFEQIKNGNIILVETKEYKNGEEKVVFMNFNNLP